MSRRPSRSRRSVTRGSLFHSVLGLAAGRPVFTADRYLSDSSTGKTAAFVDWCDPTHVLAQSTGARQAAIPAAHADYGGSLCASFAGGQFYVSSRAAAKWDFVHNGASCETFFVLTPLDAAATAVLYATRTGASGAQVYTAGGSYTYFVQASSGGIAATPFGTATNGVPTFTAVRHAEPPYEVRLKGTVGASGNASPSNEASDSPLQLGGLSNATFMSTMRWALIGFFPALTTNQRATVHAWIQQRTGIAP